MNFRLQITGTKSQEPRAKSKDQRIKNKEQRTKNKDYLVLIEIFCFFQTSDKKKQDQGINLKKFFPLE